MPFEYGYSLSWNSYRLMPSISPSSKPTHTNTYRFEEYRKIKKLLYSINLSAVSLLLLTHKTK